jgi:dipeptidyl aminopeptidase/acylaminoacyl peptidase
MTPEHVYELTWTADPRLDPTGTTVAYVVARVDREDNDYGGSIWLAPVDGSTPPRRFTSGDKRETTPRWSPDGTRLAFLAKRGESKAAQLYVIPVEGGEAVRLTDLKEDVSDPAWSPDGKRIAFGSRLQDEAYEEEDERKRRPRRITRLVYKLDNVGFTVDRRQQIFVVAADGSSEPEQLTSGEWENSEPAWSPDGMRIAFVSGRSEDWDINLESDIFVVPAEGGEPERLTSADGTCEGPAWSPDGTRIAYRWTPDLRDFPRHTRIAVIDVATRERRVLTDVREPIWDGERIVFSLEDGGNTHVYGVAADGSSAPELLVGGERVVSGYDLAGGTLVHSSATGTTMREVYSGEKRLTDVGRDFVTGRELVEPERFTAVSADGAEIDAWLVRPAGFVDGTRYPVLLSIHGGPYTQYTAAFFDEFQVYAGAGYAVLYSNPRGSSGYSEAWGRAICGPLDGRGPGWGTRDFEDLTAVVDEGLRRFEFLDPERLGVIGGSYGGFMTSWVVGHTDRFRAAISERAVNQLFSAYGSSDFFWAFMRHFGGSPYDEGGVEAYLRHSPATYAREIETPLLIMHSEQDLRCDVEQGEHLFITMRLLRKQVEMVRFPAESHELSRSGSPLHRVARFETILDWFGRWL